jgi:hypothetical protein
VASYSAVIDLIVKNQGALKKIQDEIDGIYDSINKIKNSFYINEKPLIALQKQAKELEKIAQAQQRQIKQKEQEIVQQSKLNAAVDLYERRLKQAANSGASSLTKFQGQIKEIEAAFKFFKDKGNVTAVQALATELGRMVEYSNTVNRNERARAATLSQIRGFAKQLTDYELRGLNTATAREKFDKLATVAGSNQLNEVKKYTEALIRQLQLLKEKAALQAQITKETGAMQGALGRLEEEQRQLENSKLDEKALQIQAALDKQAAAAAETAAQTAQLNQRQQEFTERTDAAARAASRQTAEYLRMQRAAKEVARINQIARPAQLLLPQAAPGSPAMSGGARSLITGPVERAGSPSGSGRFARTADEAAMALRYAQALREQVRPLSQIQALYGGIYREATELQKVKALPDTETLNAAVRGIKQLETAEDRLNRERQESVQRLQQLDRLEESRARRAQKLQNIASYLNEQIPPGTAPPLPPRAKGMFNVPTTGAKPTAQGGPRPGSLDFNPNPTAENLALGAGFPLLFGGGPAQVAGGLAGSMFGAGFGGQILGSAIAQQLADALMRVKEIGSAANQLNMDTLRESTVYVNAELETSIRLLVEAGKTEEARTLAIEEAAAALALTPDAMKDINNATNALNGEWDQFVGAITGTLSILGAPFAAALAGILRIVTMATTGFNTINTYIFGGIKGFVDWLAKLLNIKGILDKIGSFFGRRSEQQEKEIAALAATNEKLLRELQTRKQILDLEAQRTLGRTEAEKMINAELTKQQAQIQIKAEYDAKELALRNEIGTKSAEQLALAIQLNTAAENQALKEQAIKDLLVLQGLEIEANAKKYSLAADAVQRQIDALERGNQVKQSQFAVESALNDLYGAQLQRQYEIAGTASERYRIALLQFQQQVKAANIEYKLALANNQILIEKAVLQTKLIELKYKEVAAEKEIALAQAGARGNTPQQIAAIAGSYDKALGVQKEVLQSAYEQQRATIQIARNQNEVAKAVFQTKLIQAESTLAQKLTSTEIGMSKRAADNLAYSLRVSAQETFLVEQKARAVVGVIDVGTQRTYIFSRAMSDVASAANNAANNINRAFLNQLKLNQARSAQPASAPVKKAAQGAFWPGGFKAFAQGGMVTRPTLGLVGEGGEAEYIIPASKMATAASNYLTGGRGAGILESNGGGSAPSINITTGPVIEFNGERYVTMRDMERGLQQMATNIYTGLRTPAGRYAVGTR